MNFLPITLVILLPMEQQFLLKEKSQLLLTADVESKDIPYARLSLSEDYDNWKITLLGLRDKIHYPARGAVTDGDTGLLNL